MTESEIRAALPAVLAQAKAAGLLEGVRLASLQPPLPPAQTFSAHHKADPISDQEDDEDGDKPESSDFSAADIPHLKRYFATDDEGQYPGHLHRYFKCSRKQFADHANLVQKQVEVSRDGKFRKAWKWIVPKDINKGSFETKPVKTVTVTDLKRDKYEPGKQVTSKMKFAEPVNQDGKSSFSEPSDDIVNAVNSVLEAMLIPPVSPQYVSRALAALGGTRGYSEDFSDDSKLDWHKLPDHDEPASKPHPLAAKFDGLDKLAGPQAKIVADSLRVNVEDASEVDELIAKAKEDHTEHFADVNVTMAPGLHKRTGSVEATMEQHALKHAVQKKYGVIPNPVQSRALLQHVSSIAHTSSDPTHKDYAKTVNSFNPLGDQKGQIQAAGEKLASTDILPRADYWARNTHGYEPLPEELPKPRLPSGFVQVPPPPELSSRAFYPTGNEAEPEPGTAVYPDSAPPEPPPVPPSEPEPEKTAYGFTPLNLDAPSSDPSEDRHAAIVRMSASPQKYSYEDILKHLQEVHGAPSRKAAQASYRRAMARFAAAPDRTRTFAATPGGQPVTPEHVMQGVHPMIQGTALAYHLNTLAAKYPQLRDDITKALKWQGNKSAAGFDPFRQIGNRLKRFKDPGHLAHVYDWENMEQNMLHDIKLKQFVKKHVTMPQMAEGANPHEHELQYWDRVRRQLKRGGDWANEFWKRFQKEHGANISQQQGHESIDRLGDNALDRAYLHATNDERQSHGGDQTKIKGTLGDWRETMDKSVPRVQPTPKLAKQPAQPAMFTDPLVKDVKIVRHDKGQGTWYTLVSGGKPVAHVGGFDHGDYLDVVRAHANPDVRGTGLFQSLMAAVSSRYKNGISSDKFQTSTSFEKAMRKMPGYQDGKNRHIVASGQSGEVPVEEQKGRFPDYELDEGEHPRRVKTPPKTISSPEQFADTPNPQPKSTAPTGAEFGTLTPEQGQIATRAAETGDTTAWGALGDHLSDTHPSTGYTLGRVGEQHPNSSVWEPRPGRNDAHGGLEPGEFDHNIVPGEDVMYHYVHIRLPDGRFIIARHFRKPEETFAEPAPLTPSPAPAPKITLGEGEPLMGGADFMHQIHDESGNRVGHVWVSPMEGGERLHINHIGAMGHEANSLGPAVLRDAMRQLKTAYPSAKRITGTRVSGSTRVNTGEDRAVDRTFADTPVPPIGTPVISKTISGEVHSGKLEDIDNGTAIIREDDGGVHATGVEALMPREKTGKTPLKLYRGISPESGTKSFRQGKGLYVTTDPKVAAGYGEVQEMPHDARPKKPLVLRNEDDWDGWIIDQYVNKLGMRNVREFNQRYPDPGEYVRSLGYDGVQIGDGGKNTTYVNYSHSHGATPKPQSPEQFADNRPPTIPKPIQRRAAAMGIPATELAARRAAKNPADLAQSDKDAAAAIREAHAQSPTTPTTDIGKAMKAAAKFTDPARRRRVIMAINSEKELASGIGGHHLRDSEPADVIYLHDPLGNPINDPRHLKQALAVRAAAVARLKDPNLQDVHRQFLTDMLAKQQAHAFEVKSLFTNKRGIVQMNQKAQAAKKAWSEKHGIPVHVAVLDRRAGAKFSGNKYYVSPNSISPTTNIANAKRVGTVQEVLGAVQGSQSEPKNFADIPTMSDRDSLHLAVRDNPNDLSVRGALADYLDEHENGGQATVQTQHLRTAKALQMNDSGHIHYPGEQAVTVARDGSRTTGGAHAKPIYQTAIYQLAPRRDGVLTWRRKGGLNDTTAGMGVTGPMIARAKSHAEKNGLTYLPNIRHGYVAGRILEQPQPEPAPSTGPDDVDHNLTGASNLLS